MTGGGGVVAISGQSGKGDTFTTVGGKELSSGTGSSVGRIP